MGYVIPLEKRNAIAEILFSGFGSAPAEQFLRKELERYIPLFQKAPPEDIAGFGGYQRRIYLEGAIPEFGRPVASLNPTFIDSLDKIRFKTSGAEIYTRASIKENGYRMQIHRGADSICAFTRQFTPYDLRMFPELTSTLERLPVGVWDAELINKRYPHLAGFNRVDARIPDAAHWPEKGSKGLPDEWIESYLSRPHLFSGGYPFEEFEMTLAFHGVLASAHWDTWHERPSTQAADLISLCRLPVNFRRVDSFLDELEVYLRERRLNARVVERVEVADRSALSLYVKEKEKKDLEGVCVVQSARDALGNPSFVVGKSFKIKKYEQIDQALLGLNLIDPAQPLSPENVSGAMVGLYDQEFNRYLPSCKINLDPSGVQIKTDGQRSRLTALRDELCALVQKQGTRRKDLADIVTLDELYKVEGRIKLDRLLGDQSLSNSAIALLDAMPRGFHLESLYRLYEENMEAFALKRAPRAAKRDLAIQENLDLFQALARLKASNRDRFREFVGYFSASSQVRTVARSLAQPDVLVDTSDPIILETHVFDIKYSQNPFPAGFHSWMLDSFKFNNVFAERVRHDKSTCTGYDVIQEIARRNTVKKARQRKSASARA